MQTLISKYESTLKSSKSGRLNSHNGKNNSQFDIVQSSQMIFQSFHDTPSFLQNINLRAFIVFLLLLVITTIQILGAEQAKFQTWKSSRSSSTLIGKKDKFELEVGTIIDSYIEVTPYLSVLASSMGLISRIQVATYLDSDVVKSIDFKKLEKQLLENIQHHVLTFQFNQSLEVVPLKLEYKHLKSEQQVTNYLKNLHRKNRNNMQRNNTNTKYNLAVRLTQNPHEQQALQAEYFSADKQYGIGQISEELPICVFTNSYNIKSRGQYKQYFETVELINYTNFHIVYVDDNSQDQSYAQVRQYLENSTSRIKNRITVVRNLARMGALGNMFFWIKKYCRQNDIVVSLDADDAVIGRQIFKIFNSVYQNQSVWFAYSNNLLFNTKTQFIRIQKFSDSREESLSEYKFSFQWNTSPMRTFRKRLFNSLPISSVIEYHYDQRRRVAWPSFYNYASDVFVAFPLLQMAGKQRVIHINEYLYEYYGSSYNTQNCYFQHQQYDSDRARIKIPLKQIKQLGQAAELDSIEFPTKGLARLRLSHSALQKCWQKLYKQKKGDSKQKL